MDREEVLIGYVEGIRVQTNSLREFIKEGVYPEDIEWVVMHEKLLHGIEMYISAMERTNKARQQEEEI